MIKHILYNLAQHKDTDVMSFRLINSVEQHFVVTGVKENHTCLEPLHYYTLEL